MPSKLTSFRFVDNQTPVARVTLELTQHDMNALLVMTDYIGGQPNGPRGFFDRLGDVLEEAGGVRDESLFNEKDGFRLVDSYPERARTKNNSS